MNSSAPETHDTRVFEGSGYQFVVFDPGRLPAVVHAFKGMGLARILVLPAVRAIEAFDLAEADLAMATDWVKAHHEDVVAAWMTGLMASEGRPPLRVAAVSYDVSQRALAMELPDSSRLQLVISEDPTLSAAVNEAVVEVVAIAAGEVLYWPKLGHYRRVSDLFAVVSGQAGWPRETRIALADAVNERPATAASMPAATAAATPASGGRGSPAPTPIKSLLGLILYREGYVTQSQLRQIFEQQQSHRKLGREVGFGQVGIDLGLLSREQLQFGLHLQNSLAHAADGAKPLGVALLESAVVKPSQLLAALETQRQSGERLGEVLVRTGLISAAALDAFLARQRPPQLESTPRSPERAASENVPHPPAPPAEGNDNSIKLTRAGLGLKSLLGMILEREDYLSQAQVREVIAEQDRRRLAGQKVGTFGEIALELGLINQDQLKFAISLQARLAYAPGTPRPLGFFLLENGVVKPSQLHLCLEESARSGAALGQVLVDHSIISEQMVDIFLKMQRAQVVS